MRFGIMGTGGVGGYYGGMLARAGAEVCLIARGDHLTAMRREGLRVESVESGDFTVRDVFLTDDPAEAGVCDVLFFCVKTTANEAAIPAIAPMVGPDTTIISLQNGIDNAEQIAAFHGKERVMGGAVYIFSSLKGPGRVLQVDGPRRIVFGELEGGGNERGGRILSALRSAEIDAVLSEDIQAELWTKFIFICAVNGMTALTRSPLGALLSYEGTERMLRETMREVEAVGRAVGVSLPDGKEEERIKSLRAAGHDSKGSMCHDLEAGRRLEIDGQCGAVSRLGKEAGVPTPLNDFLYGALKLADLRNAGEPISP